MRLSDLLKLETVPERVFGVIVDTSDVSDPPPGLKEISFIAPPTAEAIDPDLLDVAIAYQLSQVEVVIEVPAANEIANPSYFMDVISSVGISVTFLPPADSDDAAFEAYIQRLETFVPLYSGKAIFSKLLMPVTNYLEYLMIEMLNPELATTFAPSDPYVIERFAGAMSGARADQMKARLRTAFENYYGGPEGFRGHCAAQFKGILDLTESSLADSMRSRRPTAETAPAQGV